MRETEMDVISTSYPAPLTDVPFLQMKWFCGLQSIINKKKIFCSVFDFVSEFE